jgi:uncharacterized protein (TIGR01777 family)
MPVPAEVLFAWHTRPGAFERLSPPWEPAEVTARAGGIHDGGRVSLTLALGPIPLRWELEHVGFEAGRRFRDRQVEGPFAFWEHTHEVIADGAGSVLEDRIEYQLPGGQLGRRLGGAAVADRLSRVFAFRHRQLQRDLARHAGVRTGPLTIAVTGASGMIGRALVPFLTSGGHQVRRLVRPGPGRVLGEGDIAWDPEQGTVDEAGLSGVDAVVHLAGESVAGGRWTKARKQRIRDSRVKGTALLARALRNGVLVSGSAVGFYGARRAGRMDEAAGPGDDFLAQVAADWEAAARPAADRGLRVAHPRTANVLDPRGGALARLLPLFRLGLGGRLGGGEQAFPWVALDDVVGAIHLALYDPLVVGPFNLVAPEAVSNAGFTRALARAVGRPAVMAVPGWALRAGLGEFAEVLLHGPHIEPAALTRLGFRFQHPALAPALAEMLGKAPLPAARGDARHMELAL